MGRKTPKAIHYHRYKDLGLSILVIRRNKDMSQEELADKTGLTRETINRIENATGKEGMEMETLFDISDALGMEPGDLLNARCLPNCS